MGTRSGDLDPAIVGHLATVESVTIQEVEHWLNERSGLLGLSGHSHDVRDLLTAPADDHRARLALEVFCYRARKYVGAYFAALGGPEALLFTGGIGEHAPDVRRRVCAGLEGLGVTLDDGRNARSAAIVSAPSSRVVVRVAATDEDLVIARHTRNVVTSLRR